MESPFDSHQGNYACHLRERQWNLGYLLLKYLEPLSPTVLYLGGPWRLILRFSKDAMNPDRRLIQKIKSRGNNGNPYFHHENTCNDDTVDLNIPRNNEKIPRNLEKSLEIPLNPEKS